jgi:hypothetical protein
VLLGGISAQAQTYTVDPRENLLVESVTVVMINPGPDAAFNRRIEDAVRKSLALFPGSRFSDQRAAFAIGKARRNPDIADISYTIGPGRRAGIDVAVVVTLADTTHPRQGKGFMLTGDAGDFPLAYDNDGSVLKFRLEMLNMYYANNNAWYGNPDAMLAGNPLVQGTPAGGGYGGWFESYLHYGVYGMTPVADTLHVYGGLGALTSASTGQELFTDATRSYTGVEDAFVGLVGGDTGATGNRLVYNLSAGRQKFELANAFLIGNTAQNGQDRAALQSNPRWAADLLVLGQVVWNNTRVETFYVDPDELPVIDTGTRIAGINLETTTANGWTLGTAWLTVPQSTQGYFTPTASVLGTREGLELLDARASFGPPGNAPGLYGSAELARQTNRNFRMDAKAAFAELGYSLADAKWAPSVSYRIAYFSGDDPDTVAYERWDPLLSGGNGEQWVQGINHYKVVQDANVIAHRIQVRLAVAPRMELVPQFWAFYADSLNNIGGNPALTFLEDREFGYEANITAKWYASRNLYVHGDLAFTVPGDGVQAALDNQADNWLSAMVFVRYAF